MRIGRKKELILDEWLINRMCVYISEICVTGGSIRERLIRYLKFTSNNQMLKDCKEICSINNLPDYHEPKWAFRYLTYDIIKIYKSYLNNEIYYGSDYDYKIIEKYFL